MKDKKDAPDSSTKSIRVMEFTTETAVKFHEDIWQLFEDDPETDITIYIDSDGGDIGALRSMLDSMDSVRQFAHENFKFITVVTGVAASSACDLLANGDLRRAVPNATILVHQSSASMCGEQCRQHHVDDILIFAEAMRKENDLLAELFVKKTNFKNVAELKAFMPRDRYLTAQEAKKLGIIDEIGYTNFITDEFKPSKAKKRKAKT